MTNPEVIENAYELPEKHYCPYCGEKTTTSVEEVKTEDELWHFIVTTRGKRYVCEECGQYRSKLDFDELLH